MQTNKVARLSPTKQKKFNKRIFGFDIETANNNKDFVLASIYNDEYFKYFYSAEEVIEEVKTNTIFRNSIIFATNLSFDFFGTFFKTEHDDGKYFRTLFRGSDLLLAKTWFYNNSFHNEPKVNDNSLKTLKLLDSLNYAQLSVHKMGNIIGLSKLEKPDCLGKCPQSESDWSILKEYNKRDSEITYKFCKFLINAFEQLGATFKDTIASTAMSLFRNKYLDKTYFQVSEEHLLEQFESYYGGRTEAFVRGHIYDYNYYDFNSLYPSIMHDELLPNPNTLRVCYQNTNKYILNYEGISDVDIYIPDTEEYPLLPFRRDDGRVIFPVGKISGFYTHIELREAMKLGYVITKVRKTQYFLETCSPFKGYIKDLYGARLQYKKDGSPMEYVCKILMNSLYGKFAQKFLDRDNWTHIDSLTLKELNDSNMIERKGDFVRLVIAKSKPALFCIPIWASYIAAHGRLRLHNAIIKYKPAYCDTDSIITKSIIPESNLLGELKLEMKIIEGIIVRPKFYALKSDKPDSTCLECGKIYNEFVKECSRCHDNKFEYNHYVKIKGLGMRLNYFEFIGLIHCPIVTYDKFTKFKEAMRRDLIPNEIIKISKEFSLEDEKRQWTNSFNWNEIEHSVPLYVNGTEW